MLFMLLTFVCLASADTPHSVTNLSDALLTLSGEYITAPHEFDGFVRNSVVVYDNCTFDLGADYGVQFNHDSNGPAALEDITNVTLLFNNCTFVVSLAVLSKRALIHHLVIEFRACLLLSNGAFPGIYFDASDAQSSYSNNSVFQWNDLVVSMVNTTFLSDAPIVGMYAANTYPGGGIWFNSVSYFGQDSLLKPQFEIFNANFNIVNVTLEHVHIESMRLLGTPAGCSNITVSVNNSNVTEMYDSILLIRPGKHQSYHFHNSNLTLSDQRQAPDAGVMFTFQASTSSYGCVPAARAELLCENWNYIGVGSDGDTCSYQRIVPNYPCSGYSLDSCNSSVGSCVGTTAFNTTVVGQVQLTAVNGVAFALLNTSRLGAHCGLETFRLIIGDNETDVLAPALPLARVGFVLCNATGCTPQQVRSNTCTSCPSSSVASWNAPVTGQGILFFVANKTLLRNNAPPFMSLFVEAMDSSTALNGVDMMIQLSSSCNGACLAPCSARDDIEIAFTGLIRLDLQNAANTVRLLTHVEDASNVRVVLDGAIVSGMLPISIGGGVMGSVSVDVRGQAQLQFVDGGLIYVSTAATAPQGMVALRVQDATMWMSLSGETLISGSALPRGLVEWCHAGDNAFLSIAINNTNVYITELSPSTTTLTYGRTNEIVRRVPDFSLLSVQHIGFVWRQRIFLEMHASSLSTITGGVSGVVALVCFNETTPSDDASWELLDWQRLAVWQRGHVVQIVVDGTTLTTTSAFSTLLAVVGNTTTPSGVQYWVGGSVVTFNNVTVHISPAVSSALSLVPLWWCIGFRGVMGSTLPINVTLSAVSVLLNGTGSIALPLQRIDFVDFAESILLFLNLQVTDVELVSSSDARISLNGSASTPLQMVTLRRGTASRWCTFALLRAPLLSHARNLFQVPFNVTSLLVDVSVGSGVLVDAALSVQSGPRITLPRPGKQVLWNRILYDGYEAAQLCQGSRLISLNVTVACVAQAFVSLNAFETSTFQFDQVLNDQGPLMVVGNVTESTIVLSASQFQRLAITPSDSRAALELFLVHALNVTYGCLSGVPSPIELLPPSTVGNVTLLRLVACEAYPSSGGCALGPSSTTSASMQLSGTSSLLQSLSIGSLSSTNTHTGSKTFETHSHTTRHRTPTESTSHTTKLAFIPTDIFTSIITVCPDAEVAVDLSSVYIPVRYIQTSTLWVRFSVSSEYAALVFRSVDNVRFVPSGGDDLADIAPYILKAVQNQSIWVRLGPINYNPFETRVILLEVGPDAALVSPLVSAIRVSFTISPRATTVTSQVATSIATTTSSVAVATLNSVAARSQSRVQMLLSLTVCSYAADNQAYSFLGVGFGGKDGYYYRGAVVGNSVFVLMVVTVGLCVILGVSFNSAKHKIRFWGDETFLATSAKLFSTTHVPGVMMVPLSLLLQPTVSSSVALFMLDSSDVSDVVLGLVGVAMSLGAVVYVFMTILIRRPPTALLYVGIRGVSKDSDDDDDDGPTPNHAAASYFRILEDWVVPPIHWVTADPLSKSWKRRHLQMFADNNSMWFTVFGMASDFVVAVFNGIATGGNASVCLVQLIVMTIIFAVQSVLLVQTSPTLGRLAHVSVSLTCVMSLSCAILILISSVTAGQAARTVTIDAANTMATIISVVGLVQLLPMLAETILGAPRVLRRMLNAQRALERANAMANKLNVISMNDDDLPSSTPDDLLSSAQPEHPANEIELDEIHLDSGKKEVLTTSGVSRAGAPEDSPPEPSDDDPPPTAVAAKSDVDYFYNEQLASGLGRALLGTDKVENAMLLGDDVEGTDMLRAIRADTNDPIEL